MDSPHPYIYNLIRYLLFQPVGDHHTKDVERKFHGNYRQMNQPGTPLQSVVFVLTECSSRFVGSDFGSPDRGDCCQNSGAKSVKHTR